MATVFFHSILTALVSLGAACLFFLPLPASGAPDAASKQVEEKATPQTADWRVLEPGLEFAFLNAGTAARAGSVRVAVLRVDPGRYAIRVLAAPPGQDGHPAHEWRRRSGALAVVNAGQYMPDGNYIGLLIMDGRQRGRLASKPEGLFVAGPEDPSLAKARVLDLRYTAFDLRQNPYRQAAQSIMLLDRFGQIRVRPSARLAHRTAVAQDDQGRILMLVTEGGHTLWELAAFLRSQGLGLREVMCMDGGQESQLDIKVEDFSYRHQGGPSGSPGVPLPWPAPPLPAVLGVFKK